MSLSDMPRTGDGRHVVVLNWRDVWHPEGGGSELYVHEVAQRLAQRGERVTVFTAAYEQPLDEHVPSPAPRRDVRDGVTYVRRGGHVTVYLWAAIYLLTGRLGRVDRVLEVQNGMPFLARLFTRAPVVVLVHHVHREQWPVVGPFLARVGWFMESRVAVRVNRGGRYLAVGEVTRSELVGLGVRASDIAIAYNGMLAPPEPVRVQRSAAPRLVVLSRLVPHKQIEHVIELMPRLLEQHPRLTLQVLGSGWWHDNLVELRDRLGLHHSVAFHGHVTDEEKFAELARAWVHVLPSLKEGWGLSIVEAASVGTPSLAYRSAGGVQESILEGVTGLLADDRTHAGQLLCDLLADPERREDLGAKARVRAEQFSWDATAQRVADQLGLAGLGVDHSSA